MGKFTQEDVAMAMAASLAKRWFHNDPDKIDDSVSKAWEFSQTASDEATPGTVAWNAAKAVANNRQFEGESVRSIDCPVKPWMRASRGEHRRVYVPLRELGSSRDDPAELVAFKLDTEVWLKSLTDRERTIVNAFLAGHQNQQVAKIVGISPGNVSLTRAKLKASWEACQS